jgi:hypothetical protein
MMRAVWIAIVLLGASLARASGQPEEMEMPPCPPNQPPQVIYTVTIKAELHGDGRVVFRTDYKAEGNHSVEGLDTDMFKAMGDYLGSYAGGRTDDDVFAKLAEQRLEVTTLRWWTARKAWDKLMEDEDTKRHPKKHGKTPKPSRHREPPIPPPQPPDVI